MKNHSPIKVALADDHILLRNALAALIDNFEEFKVVYQANDGKELLSLMQGDIKPDIVLLDFKMPNLDGYDTARWLQKYMPQIHVLMLTMYDSELLLIRLLQAGAKGFLRKDIHPSELKYALLSVMKTGYYYSHQTGYRLANLFKTSTGDHTELQKAMLNDVEIKFLQLTCTEMTYKEIALEMKLNPRSIDGLRNSLFEKLDVKSRVGLALFAIKKGVVTI